MRRHRHLTWALILACSIVLADQLAKAEVNAQILPGERVDVFGPLQFTLTHNDGVAFGLAGGGGIFVILLSVIALIALGVFVGSAPEKNGTWIAGGMILGGAAGNLVDRVRLGHVTDFILLPSWPAFNLADCAITVGVVILALTMIFDSRESPAEAKPEAMNGQE